MTGQFVELDSEELAQLAQDVSSTAPGTKRAIAYFTELSAHSERWTETVAHWVATSDMSAEDSINIISDIAWSVRAEKRSALIGFSPQSLSTGDLTREVQHPMNLLMLQSARFDFRFDLILEILAETSGSLARENHIYRCFELFARLGRNEKVSIPTVDAAINKATFTKERHLLLHGLWFTTGQEYVAPMLDVSGQILETKSTDHVANMRRASAMRRAYRFAEATEHINRAIHELDASDVTVNADYARERVLIQVAQESSEQVERIKEQASQEITQKVAENHLAFDAQLVEHRNQSIADLQAQRGEFDSRINAFENRVEQYNRDADKRTSDALFKIVEIVSLFVALIAILATTIGASAIGKLSGPERALIIASGSIFLIGFFWLTRRIVEPSETRRQNRRSRRKTRD